MEIQLNKLEREERSLEKFVEEREMLLERLRQDFRMEYAPANFEIYHEMYRLNESLKITLRLVFSFSNYSSIEIIRIHFQFG